MNHFITNISKACEKLRENKIPALDIVSPRVCIKIGQAENNTKYNLKFLLFYLVNKETQQEKKVGIWKKKSSSHPIFHKHLCLVNPILCKCMVILKSKRVLWSMHLIKWEFLIQTTNYKKCHFCISVSLSPLYIVKCSVIH